MKNYLKKYKKIIIVIIFITIICIYYIYTRTNDGEEFSYEKGIKEEKNDYTTKNDNTIHSEKNKILIHISGSVINEGIQELDEGSRISDAIEKSGGLKEDADISKINLAFIISDGMKIYIPSINDTDEPKEDNTTEYITKESGVSTITNMPDLNNKNIEKININNADIKQLQTLPSIGESTAQKIIEYRNENGKFNSIEEIKNVKGIGDSKFEKIKEYISVK